MHSITFNLCNFCIYIFYFLLFLYYAGTSQVPPEHQNASKIPIAFHSKLSWANEPFKKNFKLLDLMHSQVHIGVKQAVLERSALQLSSKENKQNGRFTNCSCSSWLWFLPIISYVRFPVWATWRRRSLDSIWAANCKFSITTGYYSRMWFINLRMLKFRMIVEKSNDENFFTRKCSRLFLMFKWVRVNF